MSGPLNIIVVGHNNEIKCEVANALFGKRNHFKQFNCKKLLSGRCTHARSDFRGHRPKIFTTPCLATPSWESCKNEMKKDEFKNRCFVYVKDLSPVRVDDYKSIEGIVNQGNDHVVVVIPYPQQKMNTAKDELRQFEIRGFRSMLLRMPISVVEMYPFTKNVLNIITQIKPSRKVLQSKSQNDNQSVAARGTEKPLVHSLSEKSNELAEEVMTAQIATVHVADVPSTTGPKFEAAAGSQDNRPTTPPGTVDLTPEHWETYRNALSYSTTISYHTRVNVVGYQAAGKTTLIRRLQEIDLNLDQTSLPSTECLEINKTGSRCIEREEGRCWETEPEGYEKELNFQRMAASLNSTDDLRSKLHRTLSDPSRTNTTEDEANTSTAVDKTPPDTADLDTDGNNGTEDKPSKPKQEKRNLEEVRFSLETGSEEFEDMDEGMTFKWDMYKGSLIKKEYLAQVVHKALKSPGMRRYISYWDFAGQAAYYTTHQAFMAPSAVYLLVVDLSKPLDHEVEDSMEFRTHSYQKTTVLDAVRFWAGSIKSFASDENNAIAPIIVVGTHEDRVEDKNTIDETFEEVKGIIGESDLSCIAVDNNKSFKDDESLQKLRDRILDKALGILEKEMKAHWIDLEYMLILEKEKGEVIISFSQLKEINRQTDQPLEHEDLFVFLEHQHCNGFLMYFNSHGLKDIIILQPSILVNFINILLRKTRRDSLPGWSFDGTFDQVFLESATSSDFHLEKYNDELLRLLIHLKIVFPWELKENSSKYFMPCLLGERPEPEHVFDESCESSPLIRISFPGKLIPPALFHSLVVSCLFAWRADYEKDSKGHEICQVFYHYSRFRLSKSAGTLLEMFWSESQIFMKFIQIKSAKTKLRDINCLDHLKTIHKKICDILRTYRHENIDCIMDVACPVKDHKSFVPFFELVDNQEVRCSGGETFHMVSDREALSSWIKMEEDEDQTEVTKKEENLPDTVRNRRITDREIAKLCGKIGHEYQLLFLLLGLPRPRVQQEMQNHKDNVQTVIMELLFAWSAQESDDATVNNFLKCLPDLGINEKEFWDVFGM